MVYEHTRHSKCVLAIIIACLLPLTMHYGIRLLTKQVYPRLPSHSGMEWEKMSPEDRREETQQRYAHMDKQKYFYFYSALLFGIACIIAGIYCTISFVGIGFVLGGFASIIVGYHQAWLLLGDFIKFSTFLLALLLIIFLALVVTQRIKL